ncbi:hypothetical protein C8R45DRAFT_1035867 [Mycena sanguinolenta]|nr:hypothetical protein C8R45DRAFT_1035867 [Mycena sanguinolenta]
MPPSSPSLPPSFQPPQIIVVPPAEDQQPDYLVFDVHDGPEPDLLATEPDIPSLDAALARIRNGESPPAFSRTSIDGVVLPRARPQPEVADETVREDEEIVEVVKVRRAVSQDEPPPPPPPKPKSLRSRAGSAFRSIKNLARVASRSNSRPYAQQVFASSQSTQATFATVPLPETPPARPRRGSIVLTQLFRTPSPAADTPQTLDFLAGEPYSDDEDDDDVHDHDHDDDQDSIVPRGPSPTPSASTFSSTVRRRLSILSFRKGRTAPPRSASPPTLSRGSTVPSAASSSLPQTPTEESYPCPPPSAKDADDDPDRTIGEMRLDSLHFEALSFDADNF